VNTIKWSGTILIIIATVMRVVGYHFLDLSIGLVGTILWAYAAYKENDKPLLTVNIFIITVLLFGLLL
jgi:hypothetical protein